MHSHPLSSKRSPSFPLYPIHASVLIAPNRWQRSLKNEIEPCPLENDILYPGRRAKPHSTMTSRDVRHVRGYVRRRAGSRNLRRHRVSVPHTTPCQNGIPVLHSSRTHAVSYD